MLIPSTYAITFLLTILSMICWGSWANTFKLTGKWRFELFYYDYAFGVLLAAVVAAITFGAMGEGFTFQDNLLVAGKRQIAYALGAGIVFNLANMLLVAAISIAGLAVAFPVGIGLALVVGVAWNYFLNPQGNPVLIGLGVLLIAVAIIFDARAYTAHARTSKTRAAAVIAPEPVIKSSSSKRRPTPPRPVRARQTGAKGIVISLISGLLMGSFYPLVEISMQGDILGLGPYTVAFVFSIGVFVSTLVYNLYFMNLPVEGEPIAIWAYFQGTFKQHMLGVAGGIVWSIGAIANFVASSAPKSVHVGPAISYAIGQGATIVSALWGLLVWREFAGAEPKVLRLLGLMLVFFVGGLALLSLAPLFAQ